MVNTPSDIYKSSRDPEMDKKLSKMAVPAGEF
jgi:hypothetical protein